MSGNLVLSTLKSRFPPPQEVFYAFAVCVLPVFIWSIVVLLNEVPAFVLRLSVWEFLGVVGYTQAFALFESLLLLLLLLLLGAILPARWFRSKFVAVSMAIVLVSAGWAVEANYRRVDPSTWATPELLSVLGLYLLSIAVPYVFIQRFGRLEQILRAIIARLSVLAYIYVSLSVVGILIVLVRNI